MVTWLPKDDALRSLLAGTAYTLLQLAGSWIAWGLAHGLDRLPSPAAIRLRRWHAWPLIGQGLGLALALAFPFALVLAGLFSADDVGIRPVDWPLILPWVLSVSAVSALWLALLWGSYWWRRRNLAQAAAWHQVHRRWSEVLFCALYHEGSSATFRAALIPLIGPYWGIWAAVLGKTLAAQANPWTQAKLRRPGQSEDVYLAWALDWIGAVLYLLSKSAWAALLGRVLGQASVWALTHFILRGPSYRSSLATSTNDQGQDDQGHEHGRGEDPQAL